MAKVLLTADVHIYSHKNSQDRLKHCIDCVDWIFKSAYENNIKDIIFLGDLFHTKQKIDVPVYQSTFEVFSKWIKKFHPNIYLLLGNHDLYNKLDCKVSSVKPLGSLDGVVVIDKPQTIKIDEYDVSFAPYTEDPININLVNNAPHKVLCGHMAVNGAVLNTLHQTYSEVALEHDGDMQLVDADMFKGWDQIFLGHYHGEQTIQDKIEYIGSPLQLSFGEAFQKKHILLYDFETQEKVYLENDFSPKHYIITKENVDSYDLTNNFVRLMVDDLSSTEVVDFKKQIESILVASLDVKQKTKKQDDEQIVEGTITLLNQDKSQFLEKFVELELQKDEYSKLDKSKLINIGLKVREKTND